MSDKKNDWRTPPNKDAETALNAMKSLSFQDKVWVIKMCRMWVVPFRGNPPRDLMTINHGLTRLAGALNGATNRGILGENTFSLIKEENVREKVVNPVMDLMRKYANSIEKAIKADKKSRNKGEQGPVDDAPESVSDVVETESNDAVDLD